MTRIHILDTHTANRIAAGEVVERPASIVKELIENAVDAGATSITVEAKGGGIDLIRIRDNGGGMSAEELPLAFARHATSKIATADDLENIETLGFRGEALASVAAVARVQVRTCAKGADMGAFLRIEGGELKENMPAGCPEGTLMEVADVFYNTPARLKFLKSARTETALISDYVARMMLCYPNIAFTLTQNDRTVYRSSGDGDLRGVIFSVYGESVLPHLRPIEYDDGYLRLYGYAGTEQIARPNRMAQSFFINHRYIKSQKLSYVIQRAYDTRLMQGKFPLIVLNMDISGREIDVNVHPNKLDVRFKQEDRVMRAALHAVREAMGSAAIPQALQEDVDIPQSMGMPAYEHEQAPKNVISQTADKRPDSFFTQESEQSTPLEDISEALNAQRPTPQSYVRDGMGAIPRITIPQRFADAAPVPAPVQVQVSFGSAPYEIIGQVFGCYWIVQQGDEVFFIDQHAAHERQLYELYRQKEPEASSQQLLVPDLVRLTPQEYDALSENMEFFQKLGFDIEEFGPLTVSVRAVPHLIGQPQTMAFLHEALDMLQKKASCTTAELKRAAIVQAACKHAVKAGARLQNEAIQELLDAFAKEGAPMTCPHGRPVMVQMQKKDFEKLFKRLV